MVLGATTASPACTARMACSSSGGAASLSRNAAAPALIAAKAYSSRSKVVSTITRGASSRAGEQPGRLDAVEPRHPHVHQHDVGAGGGQPLHGLAAVARLAHDLEVVLAVDEHPEAGAHHLLVVDQEHPDRLAPRLSGLTGGSSPTPGSRRPGRGPASSVPSWTATRSRMPTRPETPAVVGAAGAAAVVLDDHRHVVGDRTVTDAVAPGPACLRTLVSDSCTTRYAVSAAPSGTVTSGGGQRGA